MAPNDSAEEDATSNSELVSERRNVYGNEMLYVSLGDGAKVGHINLGTGKVTMEQPDLHGQFDRAVEIWRAGNHSSAVPTRPPIPVGDSVAESVLASPLKEPVPSDSVVSEPDWRDLANNRPGASAHAKAIELRQDAPVRTFLARAFRVRTEERDWRVGANGEEEVGRRLRRLGEGWHVIHAVPVGENGSDIDHVVIGGAGVFTLNTKNHSRAKVWVVERALLVNGQKTDYLRNSRFEAKRASKLLSNACGFDIAVQPVIVVMAADLRIKAQPADVHVVARKQIARWLSRRPQVLTPERVAEIYAQARRDVTWQAGPRSSR